MSFILDGTYELGHDFTPQEFEQVTPQQNFPQPEAQGLLARECST